MKPRNPAKTAEKAMDWLCEGDPLQTANNIAEFQHIFTMLALTRMRDRVLAQGMNDALAITPMSPTATRSDNEQEEGSNEGAGA